MNGRNLLAFILLGIAFLLALAAALFFGGMFKSSGGTAFGLVAGSLCSFYASCMLWGPYARTGP
jgi:hypothetical protein